MDYLPLLLLRLLLGHRLLLEIMTRLIVVVLLGLSVLVVMPEISLLRASLF